MSAACPERERDRIIVPIIRSLEGVGPRAVTSLAYDAEDWVRLDWV